MNATFDTVHRGMLLRDKPTKYYGSNYYIVIKKDVTFLHHHPFVKIINIQQLSHHYYSIEKIFDEKRLKEFIIVKNQ